MSVGEFVGVLLNFLVVLGLLKEVVFVGVKLEVGGKFWEFGMFWVVDFVVIKVFKVFRKLLIWMLIDEFLDCCCWEWEFVLVLREEVLNDCELFKECEFGVVLGKVVLNDWKLCREWDLGIVLIEGVLNKCELIVFCCWKFWFLVLDSVGVLKDFMLEDCWVLDDVN